jgi:hypothetical protein
MRKSLKIEKIQIIYSETCVTRYRPCDYVMRCRRVYFECISELECVYATAEEIPGSRSPWRLENSWWHLVFSTVVVLGSCMFFLFSHLQNVICDINMH